MAAEPILRLQGVHSGYGQLPVIRDLNLTAAKGEVVALIGANGAGKTTALMTLVGRLRATQGTIRLDGVDLVGRPTHRIASMGVAMVPDDRALVPSLTVAESFSLVRHPKIDPLDVFPELRPLTGRRCGLLSGGEQQMVALARAVSTCPRLLVVDELSQGLAPMIVTRLLTTLRQIADEHDTAVLVVEQHVNAVLDVADRGCLLAKGTVVLDQPAPSLLANAHLIEESYLGASDERSAVASAIDAAGP
jgi:branched-chain amino acid transport system ATP-binding protein